MLRMPFDEDTTGYPKYLRKSERSDLRAPALGSICVEQALLHRIHHIEDRQVHGDDHATDHHTEKHDHQRFQK